MIEIVASSAVAARIDAARLARPGGALAFDGDGTLWSGDVGDDFLRGFLAKGRVAPEAVVAMRALLRAHAVPGPDDGPGLPAAIYDAYVAGVVPEEQVCEMVTYACAGWPVADVEALAREVLQAGALSTRLHAETAALVEWAAREGVEAFVVSASPRVVVIEAARALGFDPGHILAATPVDRDGVQTVEVCVPIPYGEGKVTRLRERIGERPLYAAFGDNVFDIPLLRAADVPVAVRPKARLAERAADVPGLVELARR